MIRGNRALTRFTLQTVDSEWKQVDNGSKPLFLDTIAFGRMEDSFMQDIDQDQVTGMQYNVIEEKGYSARLKERIVIILLARLGRNIRVILRPQDLQIEPLIWAVLS